MPDKKDMYVVEDFWLALGTIVFTEVNGGLELVEGGKKGQGSRFLNAV